MDQARIRTDIVRAVELALAGDWEAAHALAQAHEGDPNACWLHAILHKIEGDADNARFWYRRSGQSFEAYADPRAELATLKAALTY